MLLGELLIEAGAIARDQLDLALRHQIESGGRLGTILIELGYLTEGSLTKVLAQQLHLPRASEQALEKVPREVLNMLTPQLASQHRCVPVRLDGPRLHLAMCDPLDKRAVTAVAEHTRREVRPLVAGESVIRHALHKHYGIVHKSHAISIINSTPQPFERPVARAVPLSAARFDAPVPDPWNPYQAQAQDPRMVALDERAPPKRDEPLGRRLGACEAADQVVEASVEVILKDFSRAVVLLVKGDRLIGSRVYGAGASQEAANNFSAPVRAVPPVALALQDGEVRLSRDPADVAAVLAILGDPGQLGNLILPLRHQGRPVACVLAIGGRADIETKAAEYAALNKKITLAFQLVSIKKQLNE